MNTGSNGLTADPILDRGTSGLDYFRDFLGPYSEWTGTTPSGHTTDSLTELYDAERGMDLTGLSDFAAALRTGVQGARTEASVQSTRYNQVGQSWPEGAGVDARQYLGTIETRASGDLDALGDSADAIDGAVENIIGSISQKADVSGSAFGDRTVDGKSADQVRQVIDYARGDFGSATGTEAQQALVRQVLPGLPEDGDPAQYSAAWLNDVFVPTVDGKVDAFVQLSESTDTAVSGLYQQAAARLDAVDTSAYPTVDENAAGAVKAVAAQSGDGSGAGDQAAGANSNSGQQGQGSGAQDQGSGSQGQGAGSQGQGSGQPSGDGSQSPTSSTATGTPLIQNQVADAKAIIGAVNDGISATGNAVDVGGKVVDVAGKVVEVGAKAATAVTDTIDKVITNISNGVTLAEKIGDAVSGHHSTGGESADQSGGTHEGSPTDKSADGSSGKSDTGGADKSDAGGADKSGTGGADKSDGSATGKGDASTGDKSGTGSENQSGSGGQEKADGSKNSDTGQGGHQASGGTDGTGQHGQNPQKPTGSEVPSAQTKSSTVETSGSGTSGTDTGGSRMPSFVLPPLRSRSDEQNPRTSPVLVPTGEDDGEVTEADGADR